MRGGGGGRQNEGERGEDSRGEGIAEADTAPGA